MSRDVRSCSLIFPGLLDLEGAEGAAALSNVSRLPDLELLFSRAEQTSFGRAGLEATLFGMFDVPMDTHRDLPVAAVSYRADCRSAAPGWCLRADPVHLMPDRDQLVLAGPEALALSVAEAAQLVGELNTFFAEDGWRIEAPTPERWYLHVTEVPDLRTYTLAQVRGKSIGDFLPLGPQGKQWQRIMNEVQMLLHTSSVNLERQAAGKLPVSSLWFWGGGESPQVESDKERRWSGVWTNEALGAGLALLTDTPESRLPQNAREWLDNGLGAGEHLLVLDDLQQQWFRHGEATWQQALHELQDEWIGPLLSALRQGEISKLELYTCDGRQFSLTQRGLKRFWRRRIALSQYCQ